MSDGRSLSITITANPVLSSMSLMYEETEDLSCSGKQGQLFFHTLSQEDKCSECSPLWQRQALLYLLLHYTVSTSKIKVWCIPLWRFPTHPLTPKHWHYQTCWNLLPCSDYDLRHTSCLWNGQEKTLGGKELSNVDHIRVMLWTKQLFL